jgi:PAS domain S-box-containing protein
MTPGDLRRRAEETFAARPQPDAPTPDEAAALLHELGVHQIELEMQNDELRRIQQQLEASRSKYIDLYDLAPVGYMTLDHDGRVLEANLPAATLLRVERPALLGCRLSSLIHADDQDAYYLHERRLAWDAARDACEVRLAAPGDAAPWVRLECTAFRGAGGEVLRWAVVTDITAGKIAEETLRESERRYRALFEGNHAVMLLIDPESGGILDANPAACAWYGWSRDELLAMRISAINTLTPEEILKEMECARLNERGLFHFKHRRADGSVRDVDVYSGPIELNGRTFLYSIVHDVTERERATEELVYQRENLEQLVAARTSELSEANRILEDRGEEAARWQENFEAFFDTIDDLLFVLDADGAMIHVNETVRRRLGYTEQELVGRPVLEVHPAGRRDEAGRIVAAMLAGTADFCPVPVVTRDGVEIPVETRVVPGVWDGRPALFGVTKDVSALKLSEEKFSRAFDSAPVLMAISRLEDGRFIDVNDMFLSTLGLSRAEVIGRTSEELGLFVDPRERLEAAGAAAGRSVRNLEIEARTKDGTVIQGLFSADPIVLDDEPCLLTTMLDVTERRQAEEALAESEALYRSILSAVPDDVTVTDLDGRVRLVSPAAVAMFGYEREEEMLGRSLADFLAPEDRERAAANTALIHRGIYPGPAEYRGLRADGSVVAIEVKAELLRDAGEQPTGMVVIARDITDRKAAEEALRRSGDRLALATSAGGVGVWEYDVVEDELAWDDQMFRMYGITREQFGGAYEAWQSGLHPDDRERGDAEIQMAVRGEKEFDTEFRVLWPDGTVRYIRGIAQAQRDGTGRATRLIGTNWDITETKRTEEALQQSEALYRSIMSASPENITVTDLEGRIRLTSSAALAMFGYGSVGEAQGRPLTDFLVPEDRERAFGDVALLHRGAAPAASEYRGLRVDGSTFDIEVSGELIRDVHGQPTGMVFVSRDITVRNEAEERLRQSEEQLASAVEGSGVGLWDWYVQTGEETFNERWAEIAGYTLAELAPTSIETWRMLTHPDDLQRADELLDEHFAGKSPIYSFEERVRHKDGHWIWVLDRGKVSEWDGDGRPVRMTGTALDITERKRVDDALRQRESYLSAIIENQPGLVWLKDTESRFLAVNRAFVASSGREDAEEVVGKTDFEIWPAELAQKYRDDDAMIMETGRAAVVEEPIEGTAGARWFETYKAPVVDEDGVLLGTTGYAADVTERRLADERLRGANRQLEQAVAHANDLAVEARSATTSKARFLAHMSHEIRTPLNAIIGFAQLLQHDPSLTAQQADRVTIINRSGEHLLALLTDILELSKVEAKVQRLDRTHFDLRELLEDLALVFGVRAEAQGLTFRTEGFNEVPRFVTGDQVKLRQTLTNLLANAVKFTEEGGVALRVSALPEAGAGGHLLVALVEDTGAGIGDDEMGALFAPFEQTKSGLTSGTGTGLGLAISRQFAKVMGGDLSVTSAVGKGSVFRLEVPLEAGTAAMTEKSGARLVERLEAGQPPCVVLVVDDDDDGRALLVDLLGGAGFDVIAASGGLEAVELFASRRPSIVLMDLWMPDVDGNEAMRRIRACEGGAKAKIIALTANFTDGVRVGAFAAGADAFMAKPFRAPALFEQVQRLTGVRYVYAQETASDAAAVEAPVLRQDALEALPAALRQQLRDAALRARHGRLLELVEEAAAIDPPLGVALKNVIARFDYAAVLGALEEDV